MSAKGASNFLHLSVDAGRSPIAPEVTGACSTTQHDGRSGPSPNV